MTIVIMVAWCGCVGDHSPTEASQLSGDDAGAGEIATTCLPAYDDARLHALPCELDLVGWWRGDADCCGPGAIVWPPDLADRYGPETACEIVSVLTAGTGQVCPPFWLAE